MKHQTVTAVVITFTLLCLAGFMDKQDTDHERFYYCKQVQERMVPSTRSERKECAATLIELQALPEAQ